MKKIRQSVEDQAYELLKKFKINTVPTPIESIAEKLGIIIQKEDFDGDLSGILFRDPDGVIIGVNSLHSNPRRRFTIAHEIGHYILHKGDPVHIDRGFRVNFRDSKSSMAIDFEEIEANAFAAALLMPEKKVIETVKKKFKEGIDLEDNTELKKIADEFEVSQQAMLIRLVNLGLINN